MLCMRLLLGFCLFLAFNHSAASPEVRVLLGEISYITVGMSGAHQGYVDGSWRFHTQLGLDWPLQAINSSIYIDGKPIGRSFRLEPTGGQLVNWDGKQYRGGLQFVAEANLLLVINVVDLETYLRGVIPAEMQAGWHVEALKAQAIAARTYSLASLHQNKDYDICATTECQKYEGVRVEHPASDAAIQATAGLVLSYAGDIARTYYHSDSGGMVASSAEVWGGAFPYLQVRTDANTSTPHRGWVHALDAGQVAASLNGAGHDLGSVRRLEIVGWSESGRVSQLRIVGTSRELLLSGPQLTRFLRSWGFKSTRFRMTGDLSAQGDGWGHGVGMSQYGAKALADQGYDYRYILGFYYPNTSLQQLTVLALGE